LSRVDGDVLLLEDPSAEMTEKEEEQLYRYLRSLANQGKTIIVATSKALNPLLIDRLLVLEDGFLKEDRLISGNMLSKRIAEPVPSYSAHSF
jgi:ABC-type uncharacterized transport system ATPase subunit